MTVKEFVDDVLCIPVTRIGNRYITEAIEVVLDTHEHKFYKRLEAILQISHSTLETGMRNARMLGLRYMSDEDRRRVFGDAAGMTVSEYVLKAAEYYRREYGNQTE